ncbi:hypothetical protein J4219_04715 [Candidatus Woesearchaeota archaeon]|nr:hypothetical protein [Candidatus Woesearchaeota archaeon]
MKRVMLLLFLIACVAAPQPAAEEKVVEKVLVQCWDNSTVESLAQCPQKQVSRVVVENTTAAPVKEKQIAELLLEDARSKFKAHAFLLEDRMVLSDGAYARHMFSKLSKLQNGTPITDVYLDVANRTAFAYCSIEREADLLSGSFEYERSNCKEFVNVAFEVQFNEWEPHGPLEFLKDFSSRAPILVEENVQTVSIGGNSKSVQPSIHYMVDGKRVILRIDKRYKVPIKIEREGSQAIDFRDAFFDVMVVEGRQFKITSDWLLYKNVSDYWKKE